MSSRTAAIPRTTRTRAALIAAGLDLLVDRPIDAIPIDDFVVRAGVAKGSFFNHFADKQDFAAAVGAEVRLELEAEVAQANAGIADPVERIAGGMRVVADFALTRRRRTVVLIRSQSPATASTHPLNEGLRQDVEAACAQLMVRPEARTSGVLYWLGLCQILMFNFVELRPSPQDASKCLGDMLMLGLTGLGVAEDRALELAGRCGGHDAAAVTEK